VTLTDTSLLTLCEVERRMLQKVAIAKLQALNLGVTVRIPSGKYFPNIKTRTAGYTRTVCMNRTDKVEVQTFVRPYMYFIFENNQ
jgi:hypothetical protein